MITTLLIFALAFCSVVWGLVVGGITGLVLGYMYANLMHVRSAKRLLDDHVLLKVQGHPRWIKVK